MNLFRKKLNEDNSSDELESLKIEHAQLLEDFNTSQEEIKTLSQEVSNAQFKLVELNVELGLLQDENEELKSDSAMLASEQASVDLLAAEKAADIVSEQLGDIPVEITQDEPELSLKENLTQLKGAELVEFYNKNKEDIFKALKLNK